MGAALKDMFSSKKFIAAVIGGIVSLVGHFFPDLAEPLQNFLYALMAYILGQGWADNGKSAKKMELESAE